MGGYICLASALCLTPSFPGRKEPSKFHKQINGGVRRDERCNESIAVFLCCKFGERDLRKPKKDKRAKYGPAGGAECNVSISRGGHLRLRLTGWGARREYSMLLVTVSRSIQFHVAALLRDRDQIEAFMYGIVFLTERASNDGLVG
jgi:hypothetical protein